GLERRRSGVAGPVLRSGLRLRVGVELRPRGRDVHVAGRRRSGRGGGGRRLRRIGGRRSHRSAFAGCDGEGREENRKGENPHSRSSFRNPEPIDVSPAGWSDEIAIGVPVVVRRQGTGGAYPSGYG